MNRSILIAVSVTLLLALYMLTGLVGCGKSEPQAEAQAEAVESVLMRVEARDMKAMPLPRTILVTGKTYASRYVDLKAETAGAIAFVADSRGQSILEDQLIAEIDLDDRPQRLQQAKATLEQAEFEYEAALRLQDKELRSRSQVAQARSRLRGAEQLMHMIELDIEKTRLAAPFDAILQERHVEVGDYVGIGDPVARLIDLDPLVVEGELTEFQVSHVHIGERGVAELASGQIVEGRIRYVAGEADPYARTFTVELEIENPDQELPAGVSAEISIETETIPVYQISKGLISLADDGRFGIKTVDEEGMVMFLEAEIVNDDPEFLWITGLPDSIRMITVGQGFVQEGERVEVVLEAAE